MSAGQVAPSRILRKLAAYPRQNDLAAALREVGRIERTLFIIEWILDAGMQRRAQLAHADHIKAGAKRVQQLENLVIGIGFDCVTKRYLLRSAVC